jgi:hypothetical protein
MLRELGEMGMEMARALRAEVRARAEAADDAGESPRSVAELGLAFSRVARAVRQTLALEVRLEEDRQARALADDGASRWTSEAQDAAARVRAAIARAVGADGAEADDADSEDLQSDLGDGSDAERGGGFSPDRPLAEVIAGVCGDLGLERDLSLWADDEVAAERAAPGAPDASPARTQPMAAGGARAETDARGTTATPGPAEARGRSP